MVPGLVTDEFEPGEVVDTTVAPSDPANELIIEGESLVPSATGTPVRNQLSTGLLIWSGNRQLRVNAVELFDAATVTFQVPRAGRYEMSADMTLGANFGVAGIAVDGVQVAEFDGSGGRNLLSRRHRLGTQVLTAGPHTLTLTALRPGSGGLLRIGLDLLRLRLQPDEGRLTLTPWSGDAVAGKIPVYGWSTDPADQLRLEVDRRDVMDWEALAETATLVYEGRDIDAASSNLADGISVRGKKTILDYNVGSATQFALNGIQVSGELLLRGENTISFFAGQDPALPPGANIDDFAVRNLQLVLADGTVLKDPTKPDGTIYLLGDNAVGAVPARSWTFSVPASALARGYALDTQQLSDGRHDVTLIAEGPDGEQKLRHRFTVDNGAPVVSNLSPADGADVKGTFKLDARVFDEEDRRPTVVAILDGEPVELGTTLSTDDLIDGPHTFSVTATDAAGTSDNKTSTFTTVGETPDAPVLVGPADGLTGVPTDATLSVRASDPAKEPLQVTFLQATPAGPPVLGRAGSVSGEVPPPGADAGTPVDPRTVAESDDVYADTARTPDLPYQRYDVRATRVRGAKFVDLSWEGRVAADREVALSVWNTEAQLWTEVAVSAGTDGADTTLVGRTRLGPALDGDVVHVLVEARDTFAEIPSKPDRAFEEPASYDFAVAWITDTQYLSQEGEKGTPLFGDTFTAMTQWVKDNAAEQKIVYSAHTGDVINNWQVTNTDEPLARRQFEFASAKLKMLDDSLIPNGVTPGNHDNKTGVGQPPVQRVLPAVSLRRRRRHRADRRRRGGLLRRPVAVRGQPEPLRPGRGRRAEAVVPLPGVPRQARGGGLGEPGARRAPRPQGDRAHPLIPAAHHVGRRARGRADGGRRRGHLQPGRPAERERLHHHGWPHPRRRTQHQAGRRGQGTHRRRDAVEPPVLRGCQASGGWGTCGCSSSTRTEAGLGQHLLAVPRRPQRQRVRHPARAGRTSRARTSSSCPWISRDATTELRTDAIGVAVRTNTVIGYGLGRVG